MSSGTTYKTLDVTVKKVLVDLKNNWEKIDEFKKFDINQEFEEKLSNLVKVNTLEPKKDECFKIVRNINYFLSKTQQLTNQQKLDYCNIERYFMKLYLKEFIKNRQ